MKRAKLFGCFLALVLVLISVSPGLALDKQARLEVMSAVVQVSLVKIQKGQVYYLPWGSGSIVSADGLILTNCHVADPIRYGLPSDQVPDYDYLGIGLTVRSDRPPQLSYLGEAVQANPYLDLAVIRITHKTDLKPVQEGELNLPFVELADSDLVEVGDDLNIFGYPGIGGDTVTFTKGVVSGFTLDAAIDGRAWIKTDASISGGNSGGAGVSDDGQLIGVPTRAGVGDEDSPVDCRPVKDTNGDGRIDDNDDCVPIGGFINALRPVNLAKPLIEAARLGLPDPGSDAPPEPLEPVAGTPAFSNFFLASGANDFNQPVSVIESLPSGARSLYLFFDYQNMSPTNTLEMKVLIDGTEYPDWSLPAGPWGGGESGTWWIGWADADFADGLYELVPYVDGQEMGRATIEIGGAPQAVPTFSNLILSAERTAEGLPSEPTVLFPAGTKELTAFFDFDNMEDGLAWTRTWLIDGEEVLSKDDTWAEGESGSTWISLTNRSGMQEGAYRLVLYIDGRMAALSNFWVSGDAASAAAFEPFTFAEGIDRKGNPVRPAERFASDLEELHAFSAYVGMEDGLSYSVNWYIDGEQVIGSPGDWDGGTEGSWHYYVYSDAGALPDGDYQVEIEVEGQVLQTGTTTIGSGGGPTPTPTPPADGVQVEGTITDLDTGRAIPGAVFLVLVPGITLETFEWTDDEILTSAEADRRGYFSLPLLLERGECYTMIIGAQDYWTFGEDDVCIPDDADDVLDLSVQLEKR